MYIFLWFEDIKHLQIIIEKCTKPVKIIRPRQESAIHVHNVVNQLTDIRRIGR